MGMLPTMVHSPAFAWCSSLCRLFAVGHNLECYGRQHGEGVNGIHHHGCVYEVGCGLRCLMADMVRRSNKERMLLRTRVLLFGEAQHSGGCNCGRSYCRLGCTHYHPSSGPWPYPPDSCCLGRSYSPRVPSIFDNRSCVRVVEKRRYSRNDQRSQRWTTRDSWKSE